MNNDLNRALMHTEEVIRRTEKIRLLFRQVEQCLHVVNDQLEVINDSTHRMGIDR